MACWPRPTTLTVTVCAQHTLCNLPLLRNVKAAREFEFCIERQQLSGCHVQYRPRMFVLQFFGDLTSPFLFFSLSHLINSPLSSVNMNLVRFLPPSLPVSSDLYLPPHPSLSPSLLSIARFLSLSLSPSVVLSLSFRPAFSVSPASHFATIFFWPLSLQRLSHCKYNTIFTVVPPARVLLSNSINQSFDYKRRIFVCQRKPMEPMNSPPITIHIQRPS